jgi:hypothetical protein
MAGWAIVDEAADFSLDGMHALVTASARGLGRAIAIALAHAGADIALGLRDAGTAADVVEAIEATGRRAVRLQMDMSQLGEVRTAVVEAENALGGLDILVNNAGIGRVSMADAVTVEDFDATLRINLAGTFFASQAAAALMRQRGFGRIVNIGSRVGPIRDHRQLRSADVHRHTRHRESVERPGVSRRRGRAHSGPAPDRHTRRRDRRRRVPRLPSCVADHRHDDPGGRWVDRTLRPMALTRNAWPKVTLERT